MQYWKRIDAQGKTTTVESYSHDQVVAGAVEISQAEYDAFIASLPPAQPEPNWAAQFAAATSVADKVTVLGNRLGLIKTGP